MKVLMKIEQIMVQETFNWSYLGSHEDNKCKQCQPSLYHKYEQGLSSPDVSTKNHW